MKVWGEWETMVEIVDASGKNGEELTSFRT